MAQDEDIATCSPWAQLMAVRVLCYADDEGYFKANPALVRAACFPLVDDDSLSIHGILIELSNVGFLRMFEGADGKKYGKVRNFTKHQKINRPSPSKFKHLDEFTEDSVNAHGALTTGTGNREQGKKKSRKEKSAPNAHGSEAHENRFCAFWKTYPLKKDKQRARREFDKLKPDDEMLALMVQGIERQTAERERLDAAGQFAPEWPHPRTWLHNRRWEDEPAEVRKTPNDWRTLANRLGIECAPGWSDETWKAETLRIAREREAVH